MVGAIAALAYPAAFFWIVAYLEGEANPYATGTPFTLAQVMAIFGAFGLAGGFGSYGSLQLRHRLRLMATLYLLSALCFCIMGMLLPVAATTTSASPLLTIAVLGSIVVAAVTFSLGTGLWAVLVFELLHSEN